MSKKPVPNPAIDAIRGRGPLSHSPLYWWMWERFDDIQTSRAGRADWVTATEEFSKLGFKGRKNAPLTRENVRKTWARVVQDKEKVPQSNPQAAPPPADNTKPGVRLLPTNQDPAPSKSKGGKGDPIASVRESMKRHD